MTEPTPEAQRPRVMYTVEQAAGLLGVGRTTMFGLIRDGEIGTVPIGRARRVPADEIDAYIARKLAGNPDAARAARPKPQPVAFLPPTPPIAEKKRETPQAADTPVTKPRQPKPKAKSKPRRIRPEGTRAPNGAGSIYQDKDGKWHGRVTMGTRDDGKPDRRHVRGADEAEVLRKVRELEKERDSGLKRKPGRVPKFGEWLEHWVENIEARTARFNTMSGHRSAIRKHLKPGLGEHRMDKMEPDHFEKLYTKIEASGLSSYTVAAVHRTARAAFNEAVRRNVVKFNPVALAKVGPVGDDDDEVEPLEPEEAQRVIAAALRRRNGLRYVMALVFGDRQGECLGFKWERVDRKKRSIRVRKQLQRQTWQHGCPDPAQCPGARHKVEPCPEPCKKHKRPCPPPCAPGCTDHARRCPQRHSGGLVEVAVKSKAGRRTHAFPDRLWDMLMEHEAAQLKEREHAGSAWQDGGWMFCQPDGRPIDPKADRTEWYAILAEAEVDMKRLHDARHTAATVLALLEVAPRTTMDIMGWSDPAMLLRYGHVTDTMRREIAGRQDAFYFGGTTEGNAGPADGE